MLLYDARQIKWLAIFLIGSALAVALYLWLNSQTPDGLTGGSRVGLLYGIAGGVLIVFAWLLSALRFLPSWWWIGSRAFWLKGHVWLGILSFILILCHSGGRLGGTLEKALYAVFILTLLTGLFGLGLQQVLPGLITKRVPCEVPYEQIPHICKKMTDRADQLLAGMASMKLPDAARTHCEAFAREILRPFLAWQNARPIVRARGLFANYIKRPFLAWRPCPASALDVPDRASDIFEKLRALPGVKSASGDSGVEIMLCEFETLATERRQLARQESLQLWLHGWLYLHIPLSAAMLALGVAHVVLSLYY